MDKDADDLKQFISTDRLCRKLAALGEDVGVTLVLVGGCLRDWFLDRPAYDWDLIYPGDPAPLLAAIPRHLGRRAVMLDEQFGVYRVVLKQEQSIDFTRKQGENLATDLTRRDLTINAMGCRLTDGELVDPSGGLDDLRTGRIKAISRENLVNDPLRLLRIFRFAATLPGTIDPQTLRWAQELAPRIEGIAGERIWSELRKMLEVAAGVEPLIGTMESIGLLGTLLPEAPSDASKRLTLRQLDDRSIQAVNLSLTRVISLLGSHLPAIEKVSSRLRWSKREFDFARRVINGLEALSCSEASIEGRLWRYRVIRVAQDAVPAIAALSSANATTELVTEYWQWVDNPPPRWVDGRDLIQALSLPPGPHIGEILSRVDEATYMGEITDQMSAIAFARSVLDEKIT